MASPKNVRREPSLAIISNLMRVLKWNREYSHPWAQGEAAPQYMEIRKDLSRHRKIEAELQALGYEHALQRRRWRVCRDSRYVADFSPDPHKEDPPAEELSAPATGKGGPHERAATLGDFVEVARRSKAKPARPLHLKRSGQSSNVQLAQRGAQPRPGSSASTRSSVAPAFAAPQRGGMARACERVSGVPCNLRVARNRPTQQNAAPDGAVLIAQEGAAHWTTTWQSTPRPWRPSWPHLQPQSHAKRRLLAKTAPPRRPWPSRRWR